MKCLDKHLEMPYIKAFMDGMKKARASEPVGHGHPGKP